MFAPKNLKHFCSLTLSCDLWTLYLDTLSFSSFTQYSDIKLIEKNCWGLYSLKSPFVFVFLWYISQSVSRWLLKVYRCWQYVSILSMNSLEMRKGRPLPLYGCSTKGVLKHTHIHHTLVLCNKPTWVCVWCLTLCKLWMCLSELVVWCLAWRSGWCGS